MLISCSLLAIFPIFNNKLDMSESPLVQILLLFLIPKLNNFSYKLGRVLWNTTQSVQD